MKQEEEKSRERKAAFISVGAHALLAIIFFFILAWREPNPPIPEYGIELNFGLDTEGTGPVQPTIEPVQQEEVVEESNEEETQPEESPVESEPADPETAEPVQEEVKAPAEEPIETFVQESPDVVEEKEEPAKTPVKEVVPVVEEKKPAKETPAESPKNPKTEGNNDTPDKVVTANNGDDTEKLGDKGNPKGSLDERALYGAPGNANGASLDLTGWNWDYLPKPDDDSNESGRIVFQIVIDDQGYIIGVKTLEKTVTPGVEKVYRDEVSKLTFSPTGDNTRPAPSSTGKITFIIRTN